MSTVKPASPSTTAKRQRAPVLLDHPDAMLHAQAVEQLVGVGADTRRRWIKNGIFPKPTLRVMGRPRWRAAVVLDWLRSPRKQITEVTA